MYWVGSRSYGVTLVALAGVLWSTGGLFVRALGALDLWTMLAWRSLFAALALAVIVLFRHRTRTIGALYAMGRPGLIAIPIALVMAVTAFSWNASAVVLRSEWGLIGGMCFAGSAATALPVVALSAILASPAKETRRRKDTTP